MINCFQAKFVAIILSRGLDRFNAIFRLTDFSSDVFFVSPRRGDKQVKPGEHLVTEQLSWSLMHY